MIKADKKNICPICNAELPFGVGELAIHTETFVKQKDVFMKTHQIVKISGFKCFEKMEEKNHDYICSLANTRGRTTFPVYEQNLSKYISPDDVFKELVSE